MTAIIQWNLQVYRTKFHELKIILKEINPCCVCLQETMLGDYQGKPPSGYNIEQSNRARDDNHERGAAILINKKIHYERIIINTRLQALAVKIFLNKWYTVCCLYLPHVPVTKQDITQLIDQLRPPYLILGDMNARSPVWGNIDTNEKGKIFEHILLQYNVSLLNDNTPTHYHLQTGTSSVIDLSIASSDCTVDFDYNVVSELHDSDHYPVKITLKENSMNWNCATRYKVKSADWEMFHDLTEPDVVPEILENVDDTVASIENLILGAADASIPMSSGTHKRPPVPWWSGEIRTAKLRRLRAERTVKRQHTMDNKIAYKRAKAKCRYLIKNSQKISWQNYVSSINSRTSQSQIWKKVQKIHGKYTSTPNPLLKDANGTLFHDNFEVATMLAESFASVSHDRNYSPEFVRHKRQAERQHINFKTNQNLSYNSEFSVKEFQSCLRNTTEKSPGPDQITNLMIKHCHPTLKNLILKTFNKIFTSGTFPTSWRLAIIIAIPKPGKDQSNPLNYRPISLTSCLCKLLEKMINIRLMRYLEANNCINNIQSGFQSNRSTTDPLSQMEQDFCIAMARRLHTIAVFFNLTKAYDMTWQYGVVRKLHEFGMRGHLPEFIRGFMTNRKIKVRVGNVLSEPVEVPEGTPQGSVLSCTCFMVAINSIASTVSENVKATLYVDDFAIYASGSVPHILERRLQVTINKLQEWGLLTGYKFSADKTKTMHICRKHHCPKMVSNLTLNNKNLECVNEYKFLGMRLDNSLTWRLHIQTLKASCHKSLNLLKHLSHTNWGADSTSIRRLYVMLIKPKLDYGSEVYSSACRTLSESLETIQNSAIQTATGAFRSSPIDSLRVISGLKPLSRGVRKLVLCQLQPNL